jgi:site-specific recombinase XerD
VNVIPLPLSGADLLAEYQQVLSNKNPATADAYMRALRQLTTWLRERPGAGGRFVPEQFTRTALETYLVELERAGYSVSHRARMKAAASGFARWLIEEKELMRRNPTRGVEVPAQAALAPRRLTPDQRYVLKNLVERDGTPRTAALFALGFWAGCRVSDVSWLRMEDAHVGPKVGWLKVGHKGGKTREIDLVNDARRPLHDYIQRGGRDPESPYVFTSQRGEHLTEGAIHHWFRTLKSAATKDEWELFSDITYHDLRHDFAHRAREGGWTLEEVAYYLGHITKRGTPAVQTTVRYTQASRDQVRDKLRLLRG